MIMIHQSGIAGHAGIILMLNHHHSWVWQYLTGWSNSVLNHHESMVW
jgi:hypothetical protein